MGLGWARITNDIDDSPEDNPKKREAQLVLGGNCGCICGRRHVHKIYAMQLALNPLE